MPRIKVDPARVARKGVMDLRPYIPGKPLEEVREEYGLDQVVKLASNECPLPPDRALVDAVAKAAENLRRYPDGACRAVARALAQRDGLSPEHFCFGNGAEECIRLVAQAFLDPEDNAVLPQPIFDAYETATLLAGASCKFVPLDGWRMDMRAMAQAVDDNTKLVWLCSPANPTGPVVTRTEVQELLDALPDTVLVVLDEAYYEFVTSPDAAHAEHWLGPDNANRDERVIGLRTFSKAYGLAGLRMGYIQAHPALAELCAKVKLPFNVNVLAQAAALHMLEHPDTARAHVDMIIAERTRVAAELERRGMAVAPSEANFMLAELPPGHPVDVDALFPRLLGKGFIVRPGGIWGLPRCMRLSLGTPDQNDAFLARLDEVLRETADA